MNSELINYRQYLQAELKRLTGLNSDMLSTKKLEMAIKILKGDQEPESKEV